MLKIGDKIICIARLARHHSFEYGKEYSVVYVNLNTDGSSWKEFKIRVDGGLSWWFQKEEFDSWFMTNAYERMKKLEIC